MPDNYSFNAFGAAVSRPSYVFADGTMDRLEAAKRLVNRDGFKVTTALLNALIGAATGSNVTATHRELAYPTPGRSPLLDRGGRIATTVITDINRNTNAADVTALKNFLTASAQTRKAPASYPVNRNGLNQKQF